MDALTATDPRQVDRYALLGRLGAGGMGCVFLGRSPGGRLVAVKVARDEVAHDPAFRRRFAQEVAAMRRVGGFWTAAVVDAGPDAAAPWVATEYIPGPSLAHAVSQLGPLPESSTRVLAAGLAEALVAIHATGLVHRDLKPSNILLATDGPRVIDFGIARALEQTALTGTGNLVGTPGFLSPEQARGDTIGSPSDVFCLGLVLVLAATGAYAFGTGRTPEMLYRVVHEEPDLARVPAGLRPVIAACLSRAPAARPTAQQLLDQFGGPGAHPLTQPDGWLPPPVTALVQSRVREAAAAHTPTATADAPAAPDVTTHAPPGSRPATDVALTAIGTRPTQVLRTVRRLTKMTKAEAAQLDEHLPYPLLARADTATAQQAKRELEDAGAQTTLAEHPPATPGTRIDFRSGSPASELLSALGHLIWVGALTSRFVYHYRDSLSGMVPVIWLVVLFSILCYGVGDAVTSSVRISLLIDDFGICVEVAKWRTSAAWDQITRVACIEEKKTATLVVWLSSGVPQGFSPNALPTYAGGYRWGPALPVRRVAEVRAALAHYSNGRYVPGDG